MTLHLYGRAPPGYEAAERLESRRKTAGGIGCSAPCAATQRNATQRSATIASSSATIATTARLITLASPPLPHRPAAPVARCYGNPHDNKTHLTCSSLSLPPESIPLGHVHTPPSLPPPPRSPYFCHPIGLACHLPSRWDPLIPFSVSFSCASCRGNFSTCFSVSAAHGRHFAGFASSLRISEMAEEEVKTLFLSGLPDDIKEREIYNLFRNFNGYESCQLKYSGRGYQIVAFAVFTDQATALKAKEELNGLKFDPQTGAVLHIELARANSRTKRSRSEDGATGAEKRSRGITGVPGAFPEPGVGATLHMPGMHPSIYNDMPGFPPPPSGGMLAPPPFNGQDGLPGHIMGLVPPPPPAPGSNPPCSTLFVANLGPSCTEEELTQLLSRYPGFTKLKYQTKAGLPVAFVEFQDIRCSTQALSALQNSKPLPSVDRGGMRVEYAKAKMGQPRRDRAHA